MAQSLATITLKMFLPNWKSEACKNCKRALLQSPLIFSLISHVCNCTWTGEGLSLSIRIIQKGILEAILVLCIKSSKIKEGSNFCLLLSNSRTCYPPTNIFSSEDYIVMCYFYSCATLPNLELHVTRCRKTSCLEQPKISHATTAQVRFCSFWPGESLWHCGWKLK